jgi:WD40 repeat protein
MLHPNNTGLGVARAVVIFCLICLGCRAALAAEPFAPKTLAFSGAGITSLAWSPDGTYLAACAMGGACRVWDAASGETRATMQGIGPGIEETDIIAFSQNGQSLVLPDNGGMQAWDWPTAGPLRHIAFPPPYDADYGLASTGFPYCGRAGPLIETATDAGHAHQWAFTLDPNTFHLVRAIAIPRFSLHLACLPGAGLIAPDGGATPAQLLGLQDGRVTQQINATFHETPVTPDFQTTAVAAAPNGKLIAVGAELEDEAKLPDGSWVSVTAPFSVRLVSWPANQDEGGLFPNNTYVFTLSFSPDSRYLAASLNHQVAVQPLSPGGAAEFLTAPDDGYTPIMFSPRQNILAVGAGNRVLLFDMKNVFGG